ncbi:MAG: cyclase family protein [Candidatus Competibacteraceae bacterium]|nr:cyclase family protein [Candidatus Competibacteraceae bacterium]
MGKWFFLSYELSPELSNYGGNPGVEIMYANKISQGNSSNHSLIKLSSHTATHIDFPLHFLSNGKSGSDYAADDFVFERVHWVDISHITPDNYLIAPHHLRDVLLEVSTDIQLILFKTGFCYKRSEALYWKNNWGFAPSSANFLKERFPQLRAVGFDLISLTSYQQREIGREAHREFLGTHQLLLIEDMNLSMLSSDRQLQKVIVSPLRVVQSEGAPVTVWATYEK